MTAASSRMPQHLPACVLVCPRWLQISTLAALAYHKSTGREAARPNQRLGFAENFLYMLDSNGNTSYRPNPRLARALEIMFILHQVCWLC